MDKNAPLLDHSAIATWLGVRESREEIKRSEILLDSRRSLMLPPLSGTTRLMVFRVTKRLACSCNQTSPRRNFKPMDTSRDLAAVVADVKLCPNGTPSKWVRR